MRRPVSVKFFPSFLFFPFFRGTLSPAIGARKKKVLSAEGYNPQRSLRRIIVDFDAAAITEAHERLPPF
jgi:hypothetical protein